MTGIITILYAICIILYIVVSIFIIYHLLKYAINSELNIIMLPLFVIISIGLLIPNLMLYSSIDWSFLFLNIF